MTLEVGGTGSALVQQEHHLAARGFESRPAVGEDGFLESLVLSAHVGGSDDGALREHGEDLAVECVEYRSRERFRLDPVSGAPVSILVLDEDEYRKMPRMRLRPILNHAEALREGLAVTAEVDILRMHHLEPGLLEEAVRIEGRVGGKAGFGNHPDSGRMRVSAAFCIGEDVELPLAYARWSST